jgi:hypothetical protein
MLTCRRPKVLADLPDGRQINPTCPARKTSNAAIRARRTENFVSGIKPV